MAAALNEVNYDSFLYPSRYNDAHEMIRYFPFVFIPDTIIASEEQLSSVIEANEADGVVLGILPTNTDSIKETHRSLLHAYHKSVNIDGVEFSVPTEKFFNERASRLRTYFEKIVVRDLDSKKVTVWH